MLDLDRIARVRADLLRSVRQIEEMLEEGKPAYLADRRAPLALKYLLITVVEAAADMCQHLLAKTKGIVCEGYVDCMIKAGAESIISSELANGLRRLADLRNNLVHRYWIIDDDRLFEETVAGIGDLEKFLSEVDDFARSREGE